MIVYIYIYIYKCSYLEWFWIYTKLYVIAYARAHRTNTQNGHVAAEQKNV